MMMIIIVVLIMIMAMIMAINQQNKPGWGLSIAFDDRHSTMIMVIIMMIIMMITIMMNMTRFVDHCQ